MMGEVETLPTSVFADNEYVKQASNDWQAEHHIRYRSYFISSSHELPNVVASVYKKIIASGFRNEAISSGNDVYQQKGDSDGDAMMKVWSSRRSDS